MTIGSVTETRVQPGSNITTGGTPTNPTINLVASPSINGLTASGAVTMQSTVVISGGTSITAGSNLNVVSGQIQSGGTNLESIFTQGTGTANYIPLWNGTKYLGDSVMSQNGTGVTVNGSVEIYGDVTVLGTATTFNTQTVQSEDNNILLNFSGSHVSALGGGITVLSGTPSGAASTWTIDANGAWSANTGIFTTAVTVNGGNIAVSGGGAITSGGTNLYSIFTTAGTDLTTASNGLTKSGYNVTLGGALTGNTSVNVGANTLEFSGDGSSQTSMYTDNGTTIRKAQVDGTYALLSAKLISNGQGSQVHARLNGSQLTYSNGSSENAITVGTTMTIDDLIGSKGIDYALNYHANYTSRTLVDKEYVDNRILSGSVQSVGAGSNIITGGTATNPTISLVASPSVNNFTASGNTSLQGTTGTTIYASQFFSMTPYTGANPAAPANDTFWFHSGATGTITLNYRVGGATKTVELS